MKSNHPSSFRDPSGYVFSENGKIYRRINQSYLPIFARLTDSGLYNRLTDKGWLVPHEIVRQEANHLIIEPEQLSLITYPYEWSFSRFKDAALLTLDIHRRALKYGLILKDANAFNIQFHHGNPILIDTLSFDIYNEGDPWLAYRQFCQHFLAPLLLMKYISPDLNKLLIPYLDGVPVELASKMLPARTNFSPVIKTNIHMHAKSLKNYQTSFQTDKKPRIPLATQHNIVESLADYISGLSLDSESQWSAYYGMSNYKERSFRFKEEMVKAWVKKYELKNIWDIGGNNGHFARLIYDCCHKVICTDIDPVAVDINYRAAREEGRSSIVPLTVDYTNPTPGTGFDNRERPSFRQRLKEINIDCIMALALIHHLSISANCTFEMLARSFASSSGKLLIEFVAPEDSWAEKLLRSKRRSRKLFAHYKQKNFETVFQKFFHFLEVEKIPDSHRTLYLMVARPDFGPRQPDQTVV